jgi:signal transduction histidine kinase/CheY-like chemotaxis protein
MQFKAVSLRLILVTILLTMAVSGIVLIVYNHMRYQGLIQQNKTNAVAEYVEDQTNDLLASSKRDLIRVAMALQADRGLRAAIRDKKRQQLVPVLNNQFNQYLFTTGNIKLLRLIAFDAQLNPIAVSSQQNDSTAPADVMCRQPRERAQARRGTDRLKSLFIFCNDDERAHIGVLTPVGSFHALGYLMYVVDPASILKTLRLRLDMPVQIANSDGSIAYTSDDWLAADKRDAKNHIDVSHTVVDQQGDPVLTINMMHDLSDFNNALQGAQRETVATALLIFSVAMILSLILMRMVLKALRSLKDSANSLKQGDFKSVAKTRFSEFNTLIDTFNAMAADIAALFQRLNKAKLDSDQASRAKSMFLANMSHEIRTPMNSMLGFTQILLHDPQLPAAYRRPVESIERAGNHLLSLINDILDLSKIEAGAAQVHAVDFDLQGLVEGMSDMFKLRCKQNGLVWKLDNQLSGHCHVSGDQNKLRQVLVNLLSNAVKFTEQGSVKLQVSNLENVYRFDVVDTGVGISPSGLLDVLKPFQQGEAGMNKGGTGLGLAIAKRQLNLMGSDLEIDSQLGKGSRFSFSVEMLPAEQEIVSRREQRRNTQLYLPEHHSVTALVVDDVDDNREVLVHMLEKSGVTVRSAINGKDAIQKMSQQVPDVIFMDIRMPLMNGSQAMLHIKNNYPEVTCIAVTSSVLYHERAAFLEQGFDDLVGKPFRMEQIISCIEKYLAVEFEYGPCDATGKAAVAK